MADSKKNGGPIPNRIQTINKIQGDTSMNSKILAAVAVVGAILFAQGAASAADFKEGKWTLTTVIEVPGMADEMAQMQKEMEGMSPEEKAMMEKMMGGMGMKLGFDKGGKGMTTTITQCLTNDDPVPQSSEGKLCDETHEIKGNTVYFEAECSDSYSKGEVTYRNDKMSGNIQTKQNSTGEEINIKITGEYAGPCDGTEMIDQGEKARRRFGL
jgi:hypothetical protein